MIEEEALVSRVNNYQVWVQTLKTSSCGKCSQSSGCSTYLLEKYIPKRDIALDTDLSLDTGDKVVVGIDEGILIKSSLLLYILPLAALFLGAITGEFLSGFITGLSSDLVIAISGLVFFSFSLLILNSLQRFLLVQHFARPVVIRKL